MDRPPEETAPADDLHTRLDQIETRLIEQEHRALSNVKNVIKHGWSDDKKRKRAAWLAVIRTFLFSRNSVVVISSLSIVSVIGAYLAWQANNILTQQNKLFELQNERIIQQVNLEEANRRSSLIFLMSNIMDKVDEELKEDWNNDEVRNISPQLIGRLAALSQAMRPYRYLSGDTLIGRALSPERGQLLTALVKTKFDSTAYQDIYRNVYFQYADLQNAQLNSANLHRANLRGADLHGANLREADLREIDLREADISEAYLFKANLRFAYLVKANLRGANLTDSRLHGANLIRADLRGANIGGTSLKEADLSEADLRGVYLKEADLSEADLSFAFLRGADLSGANLSEVSLSDADLMGADLMGADLIDADLFRVNLSGARLRKADLRGVDLFKANLRRANLIEADLRGTKLRKADLFKANLRGANIKNVKDLTFEQLSQSKSLYECQGVPNALLAHLKKEKPELLEKPEKWDNWKKYQEPQNN